MEQGTTPLTTFLPKYLGVYDYCNPDAVKFRIRKTAGLRDLYFSYAEDCNRKEKEVKFTFAQFKEFCTIYNTLMTKEMAENAVAYKLPLGLGVLLVTKFGSPRYYKPRFTKAGAEMYSNPHSQGQVAKLSWVKEGIKEKFPLWWRHKACSHMRQNMAHGIFNCGAMDKYHVVDREAEKLTKKERAKELAKSDKGLTSLTKEKKQAIIKDSKIIRPL